MPWRQATEPASQAETADLGAKDSSAIPRKKRWGQNGAATEGYEAGPETLQEVTSTPQWKELLKETGLTKQAKTARWWEGEEEAPRAQPAPIQQQSPVDDA